MDKYILLQLYQKFHFHFSKWGEIGQFLIDVGAEKMTYSVKSVCEMGLLYSYICNLGTYYDIRIDI